MTNARPMVRSICALVLCAALGGMAASCERLPDVDCIADRECSAGQICSVGECVPETAGGAVAVTDTGDVPDSGDALPLSDTTTGSDTPPDSDTSPDSDTTSDSDTTPDLGTDADVAPEVDVAADVLDEDTGPMCVPGGPLEPPLWIHYPELIPSDEAFAGTSLAAHSRVVALGAPSGDVEGVASGVVEVARWIGSGWHVEDRVAPPEPSEGMRFGAAVSVYDDRLAVGAPGGDSQGAVYLYHRDSLGWQHQWTVTNDEPGFVGQFGGGVALFGTTLLVSTESTESGRVDLFEGSTRWLRYGALTDPNPVPGDLFGSAIALGGEQLAVVGDPADGSESGAAYVFTKSEGHWSGAAPLIPDELEVGDQFGCGVAADEDRVFVGRCGANEGTGVVEVFERSGLRWENVATLVADTEVALRLGSSLVAESNALTVAGVAVAGDAPIVRFELHEDVWEQVTETAAPGATPGTRLSLAGGWGRIIIGNANDGTVRAWHRCDGAHHGACCMETCSDEEIGGAEVDVDCGGPCAQERPTFLYAVNADNLANLDERFLIEARGTGDGAATVPVLHEGPLFFGHDRWMEFSGPTAGTGTAEAWLHPRAELVPRRAGFEIVFDVSLPRTSRAGEAEFQLRWPTDHGTDLAIGVGAGVDGAPVVLIRELAEGSFRVLTEIAEVPHATLGIGIPVRVRLQVRPGFARLKVWASTSREPEADWTTLDVDLRAAGELEWAFRAEAAPDPLRVRVGSVVLRHLPCLDDDPIDTWFPTRHPSGPGLGIPLRSCSDIMGDDTFLSACNFNTEHGYYWEMGERFGDYGFGGVIRSTLRSPCDEDHLGTIGQAVAYDAVTLGVGEFACRSTGGSDLSHSDCPGLDGDIHDSGRERNGLFFATCRRW